MVIVIGVIMFEQVTIDILRHRSHYFGLFTGIAHQQLTLEVILIGLTGPFRKIGGNIFLQHGDKILVAFAGYHGQPIDVVNSHGAVHTLTQLINRQTHITPDFLAA